MKRFLLIMWIPFLLISCTQQAMQNVTVKYARNFLMPVMSHEITVTFHPATKLVLIQDNMQVDREKIKDFYNGAFLLNKDAFVNSFRVAGSNDLVRQLTMFGPDYFNNELNPDQWDHVSKAGNVFEVEFGSYDENNKTATVTVKYQFKADTPAQGVQISDNSFSLDGNWYWYPTVYKDQVPFIVHVVTPQRFSVTLPGYEAQVSQLEGLLKETTFEVAAAYDPLTLTGAE
jgi:hypothetical protein